jgi:septal ring factor EnvC (AmiA/AmiB activator)
MPDNNCKDCPYIAGLEKRVSDIEQEVKEINKDIAAIQSDSKVSEEQIKMIFKILNEIKDSIKLIGDKIDVLEQKPARRWDDITKTAVTVALTAVVTFIMSKVLN